MKIVEGYEQAKIRLSRQSAAKYGNISPAVKNRLKDVFGREIEPQEAVRRILKDVQDSGDAALIDYTLKIDGVKLTSIEIEHQAITQAYDSADKKLIEALELAAERIGQFHLEQKKAIGNGIYGGDWEQVIRPLMRVGLYIPGGTASYPSTVLATAIPARVAGVKEIIIVTPPQKDGTVPDTTLAAARIAGIDRVFSIGGAQAIAAMAYGTNTVPQVDKICGPGNLFVMLAKREVFGTVGIDALQGPSEVVVIADENANPAYCAADLLAQAEHDILAQSTFITTSRKLADEVDKQIKVQLETLSRRNIARESLESNGTIAIVDSVEQAIELANIYAPEHLELLIRNAEEYIDRVTNAGCVFLGKYSTEPIGDYVAGPSHALPTGGTARFSSPLNILDFIKIIDVVKVDKGLMNQLGKAAVTIARAEGLDAHARAVEKRLEDLA